MLKYIFIEWEDGVITYHEKDIAQSAFMKAIIETKAARKVWEEEIDEDLHRD